MLITGLIGRETLTFNLIVGLGKNIACICHARPVVMMTCIFLISVVVGVRIVDSIIMFAPFNNQTNQFIVMVVRYYNRYLQQ